MKRTIQQQNWNWDHTQLHKQPIVVIMLEPKQWMSTILRPIPGAKDRH